MGFFQHGFAGDSAWHYCVVRTIKDLGTYPWGVPELVMRTEPDTYPVLFHRIASLFNIETIRNKQYLPSLVLFAGSFALFVPYAVYVGTDLLELPNAWIPALLAGLFYLTLTSNTILRGDRILYCNLSERLLASLCCSWYTLGMAVYLAYEDAPSLVLSVAAGALALISSLFARQALLFPTLILSLLSFNLRPLLILAGAIAGAAILDRGYFVKGVIQHIQFSRFYSRFTKKSPYYQSCLSRFPSFKHPFLTRAWIRDILDHEPCRTLKSNPELPLFLILGGFGATSAYEQSSALVTWASVIVFVATSTSWLNFLGEASRYIEFNLRFILPLALGLHMYLAPDWPVFVLIGLYGAYSIRCNLIWNSQLKSMDFPSSDPLSEFLSKHPIPADAMTFGVPFYLGTEVCARVGAAAISHQGTAYSSDMHARFLEAMPFLKKDWDNLFKDFAVSHVIVNNGIESHAKTLFPWWYDFSSLQLVGESAHYRLYEVKQELS